MNRLPPINVSHYDASLGLQGDDRQDSTRPGRTTYEATSEVVLNSGTVDDQAGAAALVRTEWPLQSALGFASDESELDPPLPARNTWRIEAATTDRLPPDEQGVADSNQDDNR